MLVFQCKFQEKTSNGAMFTNHPLCLSSLFKALFSKPDHVTACYDCTEKHFFQILKLFLFTPLPSLIMKAKRIWACLGQRLKSTLT